MIGYFGAKLQAGVQLKMIEAENDRLRQEHAERHFEHRQGVYHDFLHAAHRFHLGGGGAQPFDQKTLAEWMDFSEHKIVAVRLFGTEEAVAAVDDLERLVDSILEETGDVRSVSGGGDLGTLLKDAYRPQQAEWLEKYRAVVAAMRADVKPK